MAVKKVKPVPKDIDIAQDGTRRRRIQLGERRGGGDVAKAVQPRERRIVEDEPRLVGVHGES